MGEENFPFAIVRNAFSIPESGKFVDRIDEEERDKDDITKSADALTFIGEGLKANLSNKGVTSGKGATHLEKGAGMLTYSNICDQVNWLSRSVGV